MVIQLSPTGIAYTSFRHWRTILVFTLLGLASTIAYTLIATPKYEADAQLVVHFSSQPTTTPGAAPVGAASQTPADYAEIINDYMNMLAGNDLAERVIQEIGLAKMYPKYIPDGSWVSGAADWVSRLLGVYKTPMEKAIYRFTVKDLDVEQGRDSNTIHIALLNPDPDVAKKATALLIDYFLEQEAAIGRNPQLEFIRSQVGLYKTQVDDAQAAMQRFQQENHITSMDEETSYFLKQRSDVEAQANQNNVQIELDQNKIQVLKGQLAQLHDVIPLNQEDRDPALDAARTALVSLQVKEQSLLSILGPESPVVLDTQAQIAKINDVVKGFSSRSKLNQVAPNPTYEAIQTSLIQAQADLAGALKAQPVITSQLNSLNARLATRIAAQTKYQDLVREYQVDDENYRQYLQGVQQARIADDLNKQKVTTISLFDAARLAQSFPTYPKIYLVVPIGIVVGIIFGFIAAFLFEHWDERLNTPWQVKEVLDLPLLGSMGMVEKTGRGSGSVGAVTRTLLLLAAIVAAAALAGLFSTARAQSVSGAVPSIIHVPEPEGVAPSVNPTRIQPAAPTPSNAPPLYGQSQPIVGPPSPLPLAARGATNPCPNGYVQAPGVSLPHTLVCVVGQQSASIRANNVAIQNMQGVHLGPNGMPLSRSSLPPTLESAGINQCAGQPGFYACGRGGTECCSSFQNNSCFPGAYACSASGSTGAAPKQACCMMR